MPEICEVVLTSQYLLSNIKNKFITSIEIVAGRYARNGLVGEELINLYKPLKIHDINTKGKFMWFTLKSDKDDQYVYILNTFGLTGEWSLETQTKKKDPGKSVRIIFNVKNTSGTKHYKLYYSDQRNMGTMKITLDATEVEKKLEKLAPDLLKYNFTNKEFIEWVHNYIKKSKTRYNTPIVKVLLKQDIKDGIGSGIGNYLSAEILYRAGISPHRHIGKLSDEELLKLSTVIKKILKSCYMSNITGYMKNMAEYVPVHQKQVEEEKFPDFHPEIKHVEKFEFLVYGRKEDNFGNKVKAEQIEKDRTTYWVPAIQK